MILSMTGYGRSVLNLNGAQYHVEIKTLNSKSTDIRCKLPNVFAESEMMIRKLVADEVLRGRIELNILPGEGLASEDTTINSNLFHTYFKHLKSLSSELAVSDSDIFAAVMRIQAVTQSGGASISEDDHSMIESSIKNAAKALMKFRQDEGKVLADDLMQRVKSIQDKIEAVIPYEEGRIVRIKERIQKNLDEFIQSERIDTNRFEQEIIYYLEKIDITEEKVRLSQHCNYFIEQLTNTETQVGRILSFIAQEMGREINTLGSKANDQDMQQIVVQMKDELEKIKEQLSNIL
jgi:uncharacterized protein (TIGR00255 family)